MDRWSMNIEGLLKVTFLHMNCNLNLHLLNLTELTAGGNSEAEMATPTSEPILPPKIPIAAAAPDGIAVNTPTISECNSHLDRISSVRPSPMLYLSSVVQTTMPKMKPTKTAVQMPNNSLIMPKRNRDLSLITVPKMVAIMGPISGDTNMLEAKNIVLFSIKPKAARTLKYTHTHFIELQTKKNVSFQKLTPLISIIPQNQM